MLKELKKGSLVRHLIIKNMNGIVISPNGRAEKRYYKVYWLLNSKCAGLNKKNNKRWESRNNLVVYEKENLQER